MRRWLGLLAVCVLWPGSVEAQHPCDTTSSTTATVTAGQSFTLAWCHSLTDTNGTALTGSPFKVYRNGTLLTGLTITVDPTPNAQGLKYVRVTRAEPTAGTVTYEVSAINPAVTTGVQESPKSAPFTLIVSPVPALPVSPTRLRVTVP